jgi:peptidoglycan hydrolase CwlO-like protein
VKNPDRQNQKIKFIGRNKMKKKNLERELDGLDKAINALSRKIDHLTTVGQMIDMMKLQYESLNIELRQTENDY